jgi:hypothetical protein
VGSGPLGPLISVKSIGCEVFEAGTFGSIGTGSEVVSDSVLWVFITVIGY